MPKTLEEQKAYAAEIGVEWTDALEATLMRQGKIITPSLGAVPPNRDPRFGQAGAIPTNKPIARDPYANTVTGETNIDLEDPSSLGFNTLRGYLKGATHLPFVGNIDIAPDEHPESKLSRYGELAGEMVGMAQQLGSTAPVFSPIGRIAGVRKARQVISRWRRGAQALARGQQAGVQLGLHATGIDAPLRDQLKSGAVGYGIGNLFGAVPSVPIAGKALASPLTQIGIFSAMEKAGGAKTWEEAVERGTVATLAMKLAHSWQGFSPRAATGKPGKGTPLDVTSAQAEKASAQKTLPRPQDLLRKSPAEMESPKLVGEKPLEAKTGISAELGALREARNEPIPGSKNSAILSRARDPKTGDYDLESVVRDVEAGLADGQIPKTRMKAIKRAVNAESRAGLLKPRTPKKQEIRRRALREMYPEYAEFLDSGGGKLPKWKVAGSSLVSPLRMFQAAGGGRVGYENVLDRLITRVNQEHQEFSLNVLDQLETRASAILKAAGAECGSQKAAELTEALQNEGPMPEWAAPMKDQYDNLQSLVDRFDRAMGGSGMNYRPEYAGPEFEASPRGPIAKLKRSYQGGDRPGADIAIPYKAGKSDRPWQNPRRMHRSGSVENPEMDAAKRISRYNRDTMQDIGHNMVIKLNNDMAELASLEGNNGLAEVIKNYSDSTYKNQRYGLGGFFQRLNSSGPGAVITDIATEFRQLLNKAVFINPSWNVRTQVSSSAMAPLNSGLGSAAKAPALAARPEFRDLTDAINHQQMIKNRRHGGFQNTDLPGNALRSDAVVKPGRLEKSSDDAMVMGRVVEKELGYLSAAARFYEAKALGLTGREIIDHMSDGIHLDQSVYDPYTRSDLLKSQAFNNTLPFKSFVFELGENLAANFGAKHGQYMKPRQLAEAKLSRKGMDAEAIRKHLSGRSKIKLSPEQDYRMRRMIAFGIAAMVVNSWSELLTGRPVLGPSAIPFFDEVFGTGMSGGTGLSVSVTESASKGFSEAMRGKRDDNKMLIAKGLSRPFRQILPGGVGIIGRIIDTMANKAGADPYDVPGGWQTVHSFVFGPSSTKAGREYYENRSDDSLGGNIASFASGPSIQRLLKIVESLEGGASGERR